MKILIVDDEKISRRALKKLFSSYGVCTTVSTGKEALTIFKKSLEDETKFSLVILDISLEKESGVNVLKAMREQEERVDTSSKPPCKIFMATGNTDKNVVQNCIQSGCNDYILKPLKPEVVKAKLKKFKFIAE